MVIKRRRIQTGLSILDFKSLVLARVSDLRRLRLEVSALISKEEMMTLDQALGQLH